MQELTHVRTHAHTPSQAQSHLIILLFILRFGVNGIEGEARLSRNGEVCDSKSVHFFLALAPGIALKLKDTLIRKRVIPKLQLLGASSFQECTMFHEGTSAASEPAALFRTLCQRSKTKRNYRETMEYNS